MKISSQGSRVASLSAGIALALAALPSPVAQASVTAPAMPHEGAVALRAQLHSLMPAVPKAPSSPAALLKVTSCADDNGPGTLRAAIAAAGEGDSVDLSALKCSSITLTQGAIPVLLNTLTVIGPGAHSMAIDGAASDRVFVHPGYGAFTLSGVSVRRGAASASGYHITGGGCIASDGYVVLDHSRVSDCHATAEGVYGGGVFAYALYMYTSTLSGAVALGRHTATGTAAFGGGAYVSFITMVDSTISGNRAAHDLTDGQSSYDIGGGVFSNLGGVIQTSTIDGNYSYGFGGGVSTFGGYISISDSTISGNSAKTQTGGGLDARVFYGGSISNSTIAANSAAAGGGVYLRGLPDQFAMQSTLIGGNSATTAGSGDIGALQAATIVGSNNLVVAAAAAVALPGDTVRGAPRLLPLAANGGPTRTHALSAASPAVNAGSNPTGLPFDQRGVGFPRERDGAPDIGAFEGVLEPAPAQIPALSRGMLGVLGALIALCGTIVRRGARRVRSSQTCHLNEGILHKSEGAA